MRATESDEVRYVMSEPMDDTSTDNEGYFGP